MRTLIPWWRNRLCIASFVAFSVRGAVAGDGSDAAGASHVFFLERFAADEVRGQCGFGQESVRTPFGVWSAPAYVNTDSRPGGCVQSFAIVDPDGALAGWSLILDFEAYGPEKVCDNTGPRKVPLAYSAASVVWTRSYRIDTDERNGGCTLGFTIDGRSDVAFDVEVRADGVPEQCPDQGEFSAWTGHPITIRLKTDDRMGGCYLRFRLSKRNFMPLR